MAQNIPAPNPAANGAPGPVTLPASLDDQGAAIDYAELLANQVLHGNDGVTVDQFLAGLEYMYHVLCGRDERPTERVEFLPQYIGAPVYAQALMASVLKGIEEYHTTYKTPIAELEKTLLKCHTQSARTFNRLAGDLHPFEEVPFTDGQIPSQLPNYPPLTNLASILALTPAQRRNYLKGWGLPATGSNNDKIERIKTAVGYRG
ncbi:hypothetical protein GGG16DRAFT_50335 [Schizophyllum commune]